MKRLIAAAVAAVGLAGCIAVPYGGDPYYYSGPAVGVGVYTAPGYYPHHHRRGYYRW